MAKPKFGFTYPTVTGENQTTAFRRVLSEFPEMQMWSHYYNGTDLPTWTEAWFNEAPDDCIFLISIKSSNLTAIGQCMASIPEHLRGRVFIFLHHEPDQWRSATDPRSDPSPQVWSQRQIDFATMRAGASWKNWIQHWVCFTEDRMRTDWTTWNDNWGDIIAECPSIDGIAADCFNIGRSVTRAGADIFGKPVEFARGEERPLIIREYGQVVPVDTPNDNPEVANRIRENWTYAKDQNDIDGVFFGLVWYYNHNNTIVDPSGNRPGRPLTRDALEEIMADARLSDGPDPDPDDPQYQMGFEAGVRSRDSEVSALENQITELVTQRDAAKAAGRLEAFGEVVIWARGQS